MATKVRKKTNLLREKGYKIVFEEDASAGGFTATVLEFPGCVTEGETPQEAYDRLVSAAESWAKATEAAGQEVPPPLSASEYSGRISVRLPKGLHGRLSVFAQAERVSLNSLILSMLAESVGMRSGEKRGAMTINVTYTHGVRRFDIPGGVWPDCHEASNAPKPRLQ